jgi:type I restriction enzyme M protein
VATETERSARDPRARRTALFEAHSVLRSADNLRPDEALDELVKLYSAWLDLGPVGFDRVRRFDPSLKLSAGAFRRATVLLGPLFAEAGADNGADLFQELADVGVRAGLGQYFTPGPVAAALARFLEPVEGESWVDPFCGSGLLLGRIAAQASGPVALFGVDRDARTLRLAELEGKVHHAGSPSTLLNADSLKSLGGLRAELGGPAEGFDGVVTNPPFGASVHRDDYAEYDDFSLFGKAGTPLEILGIERSVELLRPGGRLGVVVPQSILSNRGCRHVREYLLSTCALDAVLSLPPETFAPFQGVGKAAVIFATKGRAEPGSLAVSMTVSRQIGWDGSGRASDDEDLMAAAGALKDGRSGADVAVVAEAEQLARNMTPEWHLRPAADGPALSELCSEIFCGRTAGRAAFQAGAEEAKPHVYRVLKVAGLTGSGIDWSPGERSHAAFAKPVKTKLLELGDIVLTAAAHHPRYIGAKVDIVDQLPEGFEDMAFPSAEVMVLRPDLERVDAVQLLLWLRTAAGRESLQACVTGQTAHLYPDDVGEIVVPGSVLQSDPARAVRLAKRSLELRREAEAAAREAREEFERALAA